MGRLYFEEPDKAVWHIVHRNAGRYVAACGWEMTAWHGRMWPVKPDEMAGPDPEAVCHSCSANA